SWRAGTLWREDPVLETPLAIDDDPLAQLGLNSPYKVLFIPDIRTDSRVNESLGQDLIEQQMAAVSIIPIRSGMRWLGILAFIWDVAYTFTEEEQFILRNIADSVSALVARRRAYQEQQSLVLESRRRALQLQTASDVARAASSLLNLDELLPQTVDLIRERFKLYYAGIFLVDASEKWAILRAGTGEAGRVMLERGHKFLVGGESMIGTCVANAQPQLPKSVDEAEVRFVNPLLPESRSEIALPLISRGRVIGAMTAQATEPNYFGADDIIVLQTLADQLANAISNARLYAEAEQRFDDLQRLQRQYVRDAWEDFSQGIAERDESPLFNFAYDLETVTSLDTSEPFDIPPELWEEQVLVQESHGDNGKGSALQAAVSIRGEPMGMFRFEDPELSREWTEDDLSIIQEVQTQLALALENRLFSAQTEQALAETRRREEEAHFLQDIAAFLNATEDIVEAQNEFLNHLSSFVPVDGLLLFGYRSQGDNLRLLRTSSGETAGHFHWNPEILPDDCAPVWAVQNKESLVLDDIREAPRFFEDEQLVANGIVARAILPLMLGQRVMGALNLGSKVAGVFSRPGVFSVLQQIAAQVASAIERTNLLRQTRSALDESQTLYVATSSLSQATTYEEVLEAIAKHALPQALSASAEILLFDQNPQAGKDYHWVQVVASWSRQNTPDNLSGQPALPTLRSNIRVPVSEVPALSYMGSQELLICEDVATDARLDQPAKDFYLQQGIHSLIVAQLAVSGQHIGALHIKFASTYTPSETETRLYSTIADQAAVVLSNRQLIQVSQGRAEQLQAAVEMAGIVTSILERETLIQTAVNYIKNSFDLYYVGLFLNDRQGVWAVLQAGTGDAAQKMLDMGYRLRVGGNSPVGICTKTGDPYLAQGVISEDIKFKNPLLKDTQSEIALPLTSRGRIIGAMTFQSEKRLAFTSEDITTYQLMANQLANVIESANLYQQSQVSLAETTAQYRIAQRIANARTENEVFQSAVDGIAEREEPDMVLAGLLEPVENPKQLRIVAVWNRHGNSISDMVFSIDEIYKVYDLLRIEHRFVTTDLTQDPLADESLRGAAQQWGMRSMAALQLDIRGYQYGTLMVLSSTGHDFTTSELRFYESVARLAFVALESLQLVERTQAEADRRALLNTVLQTASGILDPEELLRVVVPVVVQGMNMPVMAWRWEGSWLRPVSIMRYDKVTLDIPEDTTFKAEDVLLVGDVVRSKRSVLRTFEPALMQGYSLAYIWDFLQMEEAYAVPLISRDRVLGVFVLGRQLGHPSIDEREQEFIRSAAANISLTLETARLYQETQEANVRLQEVDRVKSEFLANMSHELRTPLNSIIGFSRVILKGIDGPLTEMQETDLKAIHDSGTHLLSLINDILDISKVEAGKMEFFFEPADIKEIVKSVLSTASALVKDRPIKLYQDVPDGLPEVKMDIRRIRQVLTNLIGNASKFTEEGFIRVSASCDEQWLIVGVQDTGIGIPKNRYDAVFASFEQVDSSSTRRYGGTGLGLPVSKSFVEAHGGEMWFESIVGEGSTFFFSLPLRGPGGDEVEDTEPDKDENRIILTVDDDEAVITLFQRFLEQDGYKVLGLTKGRKVLQEAKRLKPYAITLDIMMPDKSGWDIIKELKSDPETRDIPVIVCSIVSDSERGMSMGVADYLVKPITEQDLLEALHRIELPQIEGEEPLRRQVLIVDDSADDRKLLRRIMEGAGYKVEEAQGGAEAISKIHLDIPDLIVLDLMMPVVDGFAVLENLRINEATRKVPVIIVTAKELSGPERDKLQQRAQALLQKGLFDQDKLLGDIQEALSRLGKS
ncbi:MAG: GAF domain-containing protein, partial [Anaerolineae bacterium]|nr:GAF domain-containing protein [Anaerolineae bacterium]